MINFKKILGLFTSAFMQVSCLFGCPIEIRVDGDNGACSLNVTHGGKQIVFVHSLSPILRQAEGKPNQAFKLPKDAGEVCFLPIKDFISSCIYNVYQVKNFLSESSIESLVSGEEDTNEDFINEEGSGVFIFELNKGNINIKLVVSSFFEHVLVCLDENEQDDFMIKAHNIMVYSGPGKKSSQVEKLTLVAEKEVYIDLLRKYSILELDVSSKSCILSGPVVLHKSVFNLDKNWFLFGGQLTVNGQTQINLNNGSFGICNSGSINIKDEGRLVVNGIKSNELKFIKNLNIKNKNRHNCQFNVYVSVPSSSENSDDDDDNDSSSSEDYYGFINVISYRDWIKQEKAEESSKVESKKKRFSKNSDDDSSSS